MSNIFGKSRANEVIRLIRNLEGLRILSGSGGPSDSRTWDEDAHAKVTDLSFVHTEAI
ncbi:hypothetical protein OAU26_08435 [Mariniblastus sp.]|nr:hypothetical protein [Mariniblastus sp.]